MPNLLTLLDAPWTFEESAVDNSAFVQDQRTFRRLTLNLGVRFDQVVASTPEQVVKLSVAGCQ